MKNKIFSVGIAFTFLLMAACSHKGAEIAALNIPPGSDIAKTPGQQTSSAQTPSSPTAPPTGPTISNLPPPSGGETSNERAIPTITDLPSPSTPSGESGGGAPQTIPGTGPIAGAGSAGDNTEDSLGVPPGSRPGYNPSPAPPPPEPISPASGTGTTNTAQITYLYISFRDETDAMIEDRDISDPSLNALELPTGTVKVGFAFKVTDPEQPSLTFSLEMNGVVTDSTRIRNEALSVDEPVFYVSSSSFPFMSGQSVAATLKVVDSENPAWSWSKNISLTPAAGAAGGTTGTNNFKIESFDPANGATGVSLNTKIKVTFSEVVRTSCSEDSVTVEEINATTGEARKISTTRSCPLGSKIIQITPRTRRTLHPATKYRISVSPTLKDIAGNALVGPFSSEFNTIEFVKVSAGFDHTCALTSDKKLFCWGNNQQGQLGNSYARGKSTLPVRVEGERIGDEYVESEWVDVSAGKQFTCAIKAVNRTLWCWGKNDKGQLAQPVEGHLSKWYIPKQVGTTSAWTSISAGGAFACGTKAGGWLFCWGDNSSGQTGDGTFNSGEPRKNWVRVFAGSNFACAMDDKDEISCWGDNSKGQIGTGEGGEHPHTLNNHPYDNPSKWRDFAAGGSYSCGIIKTFSNHVIYCFGEYFSRDGGGGLMSYHNPENLKMVTVGNQHTCYIEFSMLYCGGFNTSGQLGIGHADNADFAVFNAYNSVTNAPPLGWQSVDAGDSHTCGIADGYVYCWGSNRSGQLGNGSLVDKYLPTPIIFLTQ